MRGAIFGALLAPGALIALAMTNLNISPDLPAHHRRPRPDAVGRVPPRRRGLGRPARPAAGRARPVTGPSRAGAGPPRRRRERGAGGSGARHRGPERALRRGARPRRGRLSLSCVCAAAQPSSYDVRSFGAKGDGQANDTAAINQAIDAAAKAGGGTVEFAAGTYLAGSIHLRSNVALHLGPGSTIEASVRREGPTILPEANAWGDTLHYQDGGHSHWHNSLIWGEDLTNVSITGAGRIYGKGLVARTGAGTRSRRRSATRRSPSRTAATSSCATSRSSTAASSASSRPASTTSRSTT